MQKTKAARRAHRGFVPCFPKGFTLVELLVVVVIIGILGAIMLPQYQRAVLKSRFAALMPIAKSMADSNEAYYLEHGEYAGNAQDLPVQGRHNYSDGTTLEFGTTSDYSYVLATRDNNFPNNYIVYQKHSEQFPGEIHCEAAADNTQAQEVCKSFGPTEDIGETLTSGYLTYVLFGTGHGVAPTGDEGGATPAADPEPVSACPDNAICNDNEEVTFCTNGYTLKDGSCSECDIENATSCSGSSYKATSCGSNLCVQTDGTCGACNCKTGWCQTPQQAIGSYGECRYTGNYDKRCNGSSFSAYATCNLGTCFSTATDGVTTFTDHASCKNTSECRGAEFSGNSSCAENALCTSNDYTTTFTDNATCKDTARCGGAVFGGNSTCTSTFNSDGYLGCSDNTLNAYTGQPQISTFRDNAVCGGTGCDTAIYEGNACCSSCSDGSGKPKCGGGVW